MANAFAGAVEFRWDNGATGIVVHGSSSISAVPSGNQAIQNIQTIGTSAEAISLGDVGPGYIFFRNLDGTNYVDLGVENTAVTPVVIRLKAGEGILIPTNNASWWGKANTAAVDLQVCACDA